MNQYDPLKLQDDEPTENDKYGVHLRIASAINNLIENNAGGKTIGLLGDWGAGKSSTIKQLKCMVNDNVKVFVYDAWVHSGDHLRKSFINELIDFLIDCRFLIDFNGEWFSEKEKLAGRLKVINKTVNPILTNQGKFVISSLIGLPLLTIIFNAALQNIAKTNTPSQFMVVITVAIFIAIVGIFTSICFFIARGKTNELMSFISKSSLSESVTSSEQPEATTLEFQTLFTKLMREVLIYKEPFCHKHRKLVIVIDNLDRVPDEEAKNIWILLRSFIDNGLYKKASELGWFNNLWVIVPLATNSEDPKKSKDEANSQNPKNPLFLEKVFQVRFHLPPPIHSDWKEHLKELLQNTFGNSTSNQYERIERVYEHFIFKGAALDKDPTPRELKLFINDLIATVLLWKDKFDLAIYASYILTYKQNSHDFLGKLKSENIVNESLRKILGEDPYETSIKYAALFFGVDDINKADSILSRLKIEQCLTNGNVELLEDYLLKNEKLKNTLQVVAHSTLPKFSKNEVQTYFACLNSVACLIGRKNVSFDSSWVNFVINLTKNSILNDFEAFPIALPQAAIAVINVSALNEGGNELAIAVIEALKRIERLRQDPTDGPVIYPYFKPLTDEMRAGEITWLKSLNKMNSEPNLKKALSEIEPNSIKLPISFETWLTVCSHPEEFDESLLRVIYPSYDIESRVTEISYAISDNKYDDRYINFIKRELCVQANSNLIQNIFQALYHFVKSGIPLPPWACLLQDLLINDGLCPELDTLVESMNKEGVFTHILGESKASTDHLSIGILSFICILIHDPDLKIDKGMPASSEGMATVKYYTNMPAHESADIFLNKLVDFVDQKNLHEVLVLLGNRNQSKTTFLKHLFSKFSNQSRIHTLPEAKPLFDLLKKSS